MGGIGLLHARPQHAEGRAANCGTAWRLGVPEDYETHRPPWHWRYTAGAIASIAFNQPKPLLDGNVIRVLTRLFGIAENPQEKITNDLLWHLLEQLVTTADSLPNPQSTIRNPQSSPRCSHLNQSLMELGALICTPKQPQCRLCPVQKLCLAHRTGRVDSLPNLGPRAAATARHFLAFVLENQGRYLVRQRPAGVVNAHLWEFPNVGICCQPHRCGCEKGSAEMFEHHRNWKSSASSATASQDIRLR